MSTKENQRFTNLGFLKNKEKKETSKKAKLPAHRLNQVPTYGNGC